MQPATRRRFLFALLGASLSIAAIASARLTAREPMSPVGPFGFFALAVVHVLAVWPAADALAAIYVTNTSARRRAAVAALFIALIGLGATYEFGDEFWARVRGQGATDFALGWIVRVAWAAVLVLPWSFAARWLFPDAAGHPTPAFQDRVVTLLCASLVAVAIPAGYANYLFRQQSRALETQLQEGRYAGSLELATRLAAAGSEQPIGGQSIVAVRNELARLLESYRRQLAAPLPADATNEQVIQRAALHAALGEYEPALRLLDILAASDLSAGLLRGSILDDLERHDEAAKQFRGVIAQAKANPSPQRDAAIVQASEGLAETLRDQRRIREAEVAYLDGMRDVPAAEAHFHFQLGRHYALGGRSQAALASFGRAAELDPGQFGLDRPEVQQLIRPLHEGTPSCLLPLPASASEPSQR
jgi:tetratricopeptide (TPR) repeat protein